MRGVLANFFRALTVVLIFVWVLGWFAFDPTNFAALNKHIFAGAAFAANIVTYFEVGYFDEPASTKPLLHLWSLGVEEQFYLVFPALLVLVLASQFRKIGFSCNRHWIICN